MLKRWFGKPKKCLVLGQVIILKRKDFKSKFDTDQYDRKLGEMDSWFYQMVNNVVELPRIENNEIVTELSTGVDVVIAHYQLGDFTTLRLEDLSLPILWRPQLHVVFRLFDLKNGHTVESFEYKEKMSWLRYFKRFLAFKLTTPFERHDLEPLFIAGYIRFLKDTKKQGFI